MAPFERTAVLQVDDERRLNRIEIRNDARRATMGHWLNTKRESAEYTITVIIELDKLFRVMGRKAALSKSGRCVDGYVTVKAKKAHVISEQLQDNPIPEGWVRISEGTS